MRFLVLIFTLLVAMPASAADKWSCEAYYAFQAINSQTKEAGPREVSRKRFTGIEIEMRDIPTTKSKMLRFRTNDADLQVHFTRRALVYTGVMSTASALTQLEGQIGLYVDSKAEAKYAFPLYTIKGWHPENLGRDFDRVKCWREGKDAEPDLSKWPKDTSRVSFPSPRPGGTISVPAALVWSPDSDSGAVDWHRVEKKWIPAVVTSGIELYTCQWAAYYRVLDGSDVSEQREIIVMKSRIVGPLSHAESAISAAAKAAFRDNWRLVDEAGKCWVTGTNKPGAPVAWRGPTGW